MKTTKKERKIDLPKYLIGDIILYKKRYEEEGGQFVGYYQSRIISSDSLRDLKVKGDVDGWYYETEQTKEDCDEILEETDIIQKLNK
jgi:hypothetical protein